MCGKEDTVGVRIYSNLDDSIKDLTFPFETLKAFIVSRYQLLNKVTEWVNQTIAKKEEHWREHTVNRALPTVDVFRDIKTILEERYKCSLLVEDAISYIESPLSLKENTDSVIKFRKAIEEIVPDLCDYLDAMDYNQFTAKLRSVIANYSAKNAPDGILSIGENLSLFTR